MEGIQDISGQLANENMKKYRKASIRHTYVPVMVGEVGQLPSTTISAQKLAKLTKESFTQKQVNYNVCHYRSLISKRFAFPSAPKEPGPP
jgi:hypothetical protein